VAPASLQQAGGPGSGQTDIVSTEGAATQAPGRGWYRATIPEGTAPPASPKWRVPRRTEARHGRVEPKPSALLLPGTPKRPGNPDQQAGQTMESNVSMFTSKNVSEDPISSR
jgi:hypothetical protein